MKTSLTWIGGVAFVGESTGGHRLIMDGPPESGGRDLGPRPMETLLLGMGACSSGDVVSILKKARHKVQDCKLEITAKRAETDPKVFTDIKMHFILAGVGLKDKPVDRAIKLSADKYCSASIMLGKMAKITHSYEIVESKTS